MKTQEEKHQGRAAMHRPPRRCGVASLHNSLRSPGEVQGFLLATVESPKVTPVHVTVPIGDAGSNSSPEPVSGMGGSKVNAQ